VTLQFCERPRLGARSIAQDPRHCQLGVVVQNRPWHSLEIGEGVVVTFQECGRDGGATCANTGLFTGFRLLVCTGGLGGFALFRNRCRHFVISLRGDHRGHDMNHSGAPETQGISEANRNWRRIGDTVRNSGQMASGGT
jgi:hypothetical protein